MIRAFRNRLFTSVSIFALCSIAVLACTNNPFNPKAEPRVTQIKTSDEERFAGIRQSLTTEGEQTLILYTYVDPIVTFETPAALPAINFHKFAAQITLADGTVLPEKEYPLSQGTPYSVGYTPGDTTLQAVGVNSLELRFPVVSADRDLQNVIYPGNSAPRVRDGFAKITVFGKDTAGNDLEIPINVNLSFESSVFPDVTATPDPVQTPSPAAPASPAPN